MPIWAWQETVTVGAGVTRTLPTAVDASVESVADALGLTLLGWTPGQITDGQRPATYYGLGATVTPAAETTYYAMFAHADAGGEVIVRQCPAPTDGDTVLLEIIQGSACFLAPSNTLTSDMLMTSFSTSYYGSLMDHTALNSNAYAWRIVGRPDNKFYLHSASKSTYYMYIKSNKVNCGTGTPDEFELKNGFLFDSSEGVYLTYYNDTYGKTHFSKGTGSVPTGHTFAIYRKERYANFATTIGQLPGCDNCFIYVP